MILFEKIKEEVSNWKKENYNSDFDTISEIFEHINSIKYLRKAQIEALENYWYVRIKLKTPTVENIYRKFFKGIDLLKAFGVPEKNYDAINLLPKELQETAINEIIKKIKTDDTFVKENKLEGLRETLTLPYPSYILALAMGAGKTILIASIIATEFAMSLDYTNEHFIKNALVFAPGKTILGALREITFAPYEKILPQRLYKSFITNVKFIYTQDNQKDIPVIKGSVYNVIVTNTEKIRLTSSSIKNSLFSDLKGLGTKSKEDVKELLANQRLQTLVSLPDLGVFSDEAHHTYGQKIEQDLKRIRQTINYIAEKTNLRIVINTTGTPYHKNKILRDVIYWYSLKQGIKDGILKDVSGNVKAYNNVSDEIFLQEVITDFINKYWDVSIYNGAKSKLAIYFPQIEHINNAKSHIEKILIEKNINPSDTILEVHNKSDKDIIDLFDNRINEPEVPFRIFLLVNKGTEGWNCPSLFATALARELKGSNNFALQAATRCMRQIPDNKIKASIYLSKQNVRRLNDQLKETFGENLDDINKTTSEIHEIRITVKKKNIPPIIIKEKVKKIIYKKGIDKKNISIPKLNIKPKKEKIKTETFTLQDTNNRVLYKINETTTEISEQTIDIHIVAVELSDIYRLDSLHLLKLLRNALNVNEIPLSTYIKLRENIESQISNYEVKEEIVERAIALLKLDGFDKNEEREEYYSIIRVNKTRLDNLIVHMKDFRENKFGFHYTPYNFDSKPEKIFYLQMLEKLNIDHENVVDIYFTGAITSPEKTDLLFEYKGDDEKWHTYTPDFIIRKKDNKIIIVEIKGKPFRNKKIEKMMSKLENINKDNLKYEILETDKDELLYGEFEKILNLIK